MSDHRALISIASDGLSAEIDPLGAQLSALRDAEGRDLMWDGDPKVWTGRAPILFPIVGMVADSHYRLGGETYRMVKHGFARHRMFAVADRTPSSATFRIEADAETLAVYPFQFTLEIRFALCGAALEVTASVGNRGEERLPASFGFHPALRWPLPYGRPRAEHRIRFDKDEPAPIRRIDREGLLRPQTYPTPVVARDLPLRDDLFVDDAVIFDRLNSDKVRYGAADGPSLEVRFPDTPYLGLWMKPGADYICVEPWHGIADPERYQGDFRDKPGVFEVAPGEAKHIAMSIILHP